MENNDQKSLHYARGGLASAVCISSPTHLSSNADAKFAASQSCHSDLSLKILLLLHAGFLTAVLCCQSVAAPACDALPL